MIQITNNLCIISTTLIASFLTACLLISVARFCWIKLFRSMIFFSVCRFDVEHSNRTSWAVKHVSIFVFYVVCVSSCGLQMVWSKTTHFGCGIAKCSQFNGNILLMCNYGPAYVIIIIITCEHCCTDSNSLFTFDWFTDVFICFSMWPMCEWSPVNPLYSFGSALNLTLQLCEHAWWRNSSSCPACHC